MSENVTDLHLYKKIKKLADKKFQSSTGIYKSAWIVKEYKKHGGKFKTKKQKNSNLNRWFKEKWVDLNHPIKKNGKIIGYKSCGRKNMSNKIYPLCRPTYRISKKTPKTYKELSKKSINRAKRDKSKLKWRGNIQFGNGKSQFHGKKSNIMIKIPENVKKTALYAFKLRDYGFGGGLETGWKRAKQLSTKDSISIQDLKYMRAWYARHIYASYPSYKEWIENSRPKNDKKWHRKHGIISWLIWGGNAGFKWINSNKTINLLNKHFNKQYKKIQFI